MRLPVRTALSLAAAAALAVSAGLCAQAQSSSSNTAPPQITPAQTAAANGAYISVDPLALVTYNNRYDVSVGLAYDHMKAGPTLLQGSNLGGLDLSGSYWLSKHWGIEGSGRGYLGTSGAGVNSANIKGPFVSQYLFVAGPEFLGPHNKHGALIAHVLAGGAYGKFEQDLLGHPPSFVAFYNDQVALGGVIGGHIDLNRSEHWVFRITPDAVVTHYSINYSPYTTQWDVNFALSVGMQYKFTKSKR